MGFEFVQNSQTPLTRFLLKVSESSLRNPEKSIANTFQKMYLLSISYKYVNLWILGLKKLQIA